MFATPPSMASLVHAASAASVDTPTVTSLNLAATPGNIPLLTTIAAGFAAAWTLGLITQRLGLSPIVGYLLAGIVIGPHTPGYTGDIELAQQLAEIGVILLMFGVGLHFKLRDLWAVRSVAIPGALGQIAVATISAVLVFALLGWPIASGTVLGMAMAVASTVVLLRVLLDQGMLSTSHGHAAVGWLIVEDIVVVLALVMLPIAAAQLVDPATVESLTDTATSTTATTAAATTTEVTGVPTAPAPPGAEADPEAGSKGASASSALMTIGWAIVKLCALVAIILLAGSKVVPTLLTQVAKLRSAELFTLTVLVLSVTIAVGSAVIFGASVALGAFLAGIVVAQSPVSHQAAADALPMRDAFAVLFFVSVGMLFDPSFLLEQPLAVAGGLAVVMLFKPLAALVLVAVCGYPLRTGLTVALGLAQIGEFSFILGQVATNYNLLPADGMNVLVAAAMISITLNPMLFRSLDAFERAVESIPWLHRVLTARHARRTGDINTAAETAVAEVDVEKQAMAVIVGYGPTGRLVDALLRDAGIETVIVDMNINTVRNLAKAGRTAIYGDATRLQVLDHAGIRKATHFVVTLPHTEGRSSLVLTARELNPTIDITVRARYLAEREVLLRAGANKVVYEEGEAGLALARHVMNQRGVEPLKVDEVLLAVRKVWQMEGEGER